jgi:hypothetical protein
VASCVEWAHGPRVFIEIEVTAVAEKTRFYL